MRVCWTHILCLLRLCLIKVLKYKYIYTIFILKKGNFLWGDTYNIFTLKTWIFIILQTSSPPLCTKTRNRIFTSAPHSEDYGSHFPILDASFLDTGTTLVNSYHVVLLQPPLCVPLVSSHDVVLLRPEDQDIPCPGFIALHFCHLCPFFLNIPSANKTDRKLPRM